MRIERRKENSMRSRAMLQSYRVGGEKGSKRSDRYQEMGEPYL